MNQVINSPAIVRSGTAFCLRYNICVAQVISPEDGRVRVDACVNRANTLSAWAGAEAARGRPGKGADLLAAAVEGYRGALEQEEDAAVGPSQVAHRCRQP